MLSTPCKDHILGVTLVGEHASDLLAEFVLSMKHGLGLNKILGTIHTYPTWSEANKYAAGEWRRAHVYHRLPAERKNTMPGGEVKGMRILSATQYVIFAVALLLGSGWSQPSHTVSQKPILTGASTIAPLAGELARRFESLHPGTRVDVQTGGSARGINDARKGIANIGMVSPALKPEEKDLHAHTIDPAK